MAKIIPMIGRPINVVGGRALNYAVDIESPNVRGVIIAVPDHRHRASIDYAFAHSVNARGEYMLDRQDDTDFDQLDFRNFDADFSEDEDPFFLYIVGVAKEHFGRDAEVVGIYDYV